MHIDYSNLISVTNLFQAWSEFRKGKAKRHDVQIFERELEDNLFKLQKSLKHKTYKHGNYHSFYVNDPKQRHIHKAGVVDRVVHHVLYTFLYKLFDNIFIYDSYSCRLNKGTHKGVKRLEAFTRIVSKNYTIPCWALKCDIKKFFASIDHKVLFQLLEKKIKDENIVWLLKQVIESFCTCHPEFISGSRRFRPCQNDGKMLNQVQHDNNHRGIPLGNLTSQVFANIYLNELDQFVKHKLKVKYYMRYADDFLMLSSYKDTLQRSLVAMGEFAKNNLNLELHPNKIIFRKLEWGIDFLGYVVLPYYIVPRTKTKRRIFKKLKEKIGSEKFNQSLQSYLGYLGHAKSFRITQEL